jgi:PfaD family protein
MVIEMAKAGMLGFFGAAGLGLGRVEAALVELEGELDPKGLSWGSNLIHSPNENGVEAATVDLYLKRKVRRVSASAYMGLTPHVVRYAVTGLTLGACGEVKRRNYLFAKVSRSEVARQFMSPAPAAILDELLKAGKITSEEAQLAAKVPVAEDYTLEGDSGGHTDNQILAALFSSIVVLRSELTKKYGYSRPIRLGAAGGIGTPAAVASAFGLGASYVVTGSVNQGAVESGLSEAGRRLLAKAGIADVMMAPAADMFEKGVKVQVLKRGSMFAVRAAKLYEVYTTCASMEEIPVDVRQKLEETLFKATLDDIWNQTETFWRGRDPRELTRASADPRHKMALCFRWYLGQASRWAITGDSGRALDYQIWCGPAMGAFNDWVKGTYLEAPENRTVVQIARNLLEGAAIITRAQQLRTYGVPVPGEAFNYVPAPLA